MKKVALYLALFTLLAASALAQVPDEYTNLKVLPKDIGKRELLGTMKSFAGALGMRCSDCHVQKTPAIFRVSTGPVMT